MKENHFIRRILFLIPMLGLLTSYAVGFTNFTNSITRETASQKQTLKAFNVNSLTLKYVEDNQDQDEDNFTCDDETENEIDLEWFHNYNCDNILFRNIESNSVQSEYFSFYSLHYKIPLYKLFCKWKFHLA